MKLKNNRTLRIGQIFIFALIGIFSYFTISTISYAQTQGEDLNVIITFFDITEDTGDVITFINSDGFTKAKIFTPLKSMKMGNTTELQFNLTANQVSMGEKFRVCALLIKDDGIICKVGENSVAERPEIIDFRLATDEIVKIDLPNIAIPELDDTNEDNDDEVENNEDEEDTT
ncbi:MAG TPA: hypothetical protein VFR65_09290 [Nitrososphaeraceae archaeon]|jgi:hypothetical protein|nr:hypothetical protein [Nitrososphaeraceae archaeon]